MTLAKSGLVGWILLLAGAVVSVPASAATIHVYPSGFVSGGCTLRDAIHAANTNVSVGGCNAGLASGTDTLLLELPRPYTLTNVVGSDEDGNATGDLDVTSPIIVQGVNTTETVIVGPALDRLFDVIGAQGQLTINDVTLVGGSVVAGTSSNGWGGVVRKSGPATLTINRSVLRGGSADAGGGVYSAGPGVLTLRRVAILGNRAASFAGGILLSNGNGVEAVLDNITVSGNSVTDADGSGGGLLSIFSWYRLKNSTIAHNSAAFNAGVSYSGSSTTGINLANSVLVNNIDGSGSASDFSCGNGIQLGARTHTMIGRIENCSFASFSGVPTSSDARLAPLFDFGSGVPTHALLPGSAALNAGNPSNSNALTACLGSDARGRARTTSCDLGSYEHAYDATVNSLNDLPDLTPGDGSCLALGNVCTLRAAVMEGSASGGRWIMSVPPGTYTLSAPIVPNNDPVGGDLDVRPGNGTPPLAMALIGSGDPGDTRIVGGGFDRVLEVRGRFASGPSPGFSDRPVSFALINAMVSGGTLTEDTFVQIPGSEPPHGGGGIKIFAGKSLFYNFVVHDNHVVVDPLLANGYGGGIAINLPSTAEYNQPYFTGVHLERFAVVDGSANVAGGVFTRGVNTSAKSDGIVLINGTIAGNHAVYGGAVFAQDSFAASFLTVADNTSEIITAGVNSNYAAGLTLYGTNNSLRNTVIAGNHTDAENSDCEVSTIIGSLVSLGYNLIGTSGPGCLISGDITTNLLNVNPQLGARTLSSSGMPYFPTLALSPVLDAIPAALCADTASHGVATDVRGVPRPGNGNAFCDIGAVEHELPLFANGFE